MFYCNECRVNQKFPETMVKSQGTCEICGKHAVCNEMPANMLYDNSDELVWSKAEHQFSTRIMTFCETEDALNAPEQLSFCLIINNETVLTIKPSGDVEVNPKWSMTEVAREFWEAFVFSNSFMRVRESNNVTELVSEPLNNSELLEVKEIYENFWKGLVETNGKLDILKVQRELADFHFLIENVPKVYDYITGGVLSKHKYHAQIVIDESDNYSQHITDEAIHEHCEELYHKLIAEIGVVFRKYENNFTNSVQRNYVHSAIRGALMQYLLKVENVDAKKETDKTNES